VNGALSIVTANKSATRAASGSPGSVIATTRRRRAASQPIMTARRGSRSASPDRKIPPRKIGTTPMMNVTAASSADRVRS
jgi:hypothetical protein